MLERTTEAIAGLEAIADDPQGYAQRWKDEHDRKVIGSFPMNFPAELVHAAGMLPVVVQESREAITEGRNLMFEFYCGYTRSLADQAAKGQLDVFDGFLFVDHCIQLLGAADGVRSRLDGRPMLYAQLVPSMDEPWTGEQVREQVGDMREQLEAIAGRPIADDDLAASIALFNRNRALLREIHALRRGGRAPLTASQMQALVKSSMVMDKARHTEVLEAIRDDLVDAAGAAPERIRVHLSGHFCQAPQPALLDAIEECGAVVVDDDLYHGFRYISTDVAAEGDPFAALAAWYQDRNVTVPCPTRVQRDVDWDDYLVDALAASGAEAVIVLMAKFCEPHMLYYPELRKALDARAVPHLLVETEHEGLPLEAFRTRVETLLERVRRDRDLVPAGAPA
ncbi:MAG TPA: 2-hydroxyacyl-CoA dehydratase family protein [Baekduia sp.]|uniref:2-hydroxyacyl-CoA dehydratase subunit D n=1 Tax=Baekduia sp. TaxID=2600305 RepID=UPI002D7660C5|nr:2-hydroxyacyl-CoA dehydratase family protein [Baekduia sp.]HET6507885.1 2-hydroxyacyl-CoA dehydratase family protein [Baekduia sp.]